MRKQCRSAGDQENSRKHKKCNVKRLIVKQYFEDRINKIISSTETDISFTEDDLKHYPRYLYKYRDCKQDYNFQMIEEEYLWADIPASFYDPYDALVNLKLKSELPYIQKWLFDHLGEILYYSLPPKGMAVHKRGQTLQNYLDAQERFKDASGKYNANKAKKLMLLETKNMDPANRLKLQKVYDKFESPDFEETLNQAIENTLKSVVNSLREKNKVCCLTERNNNQKMWEDYADKYTGFVIEFDLEKAYNHIECIKIISKLFPVTYYKRMPKVPLLPFIKKAFYKELYGKDVCDDAERKLFKQLLIKKNDYCSEEEWRIISSESRIPFPLISAIYAGDLISDDDLSALKSICEEKHIELYKQRFSLVGNMRFDLIYKHEERN